MRSANVGTGGEKSGLGLFILVGIRVGVGFGVGLTVGETERSNVVVGSGVEVGGDETDVGTGMNCAVGVGAAVGVGSRLGAFVGDGLAVTNVGGGAAVIGGDIGADGVATGLATNK